MDYHGVSWDVNESPGKARDFLDFLWIFLASTPQALTFRQTLQIELKNQAAGLARYYGFGIAHHPPLSRQRGPRGILRQAQDEA